MNLSKCRITYLNTLTDVIGIVRDEKGITYIGVAKSQDNDTNIERIIKTGAYINLMEIDTILS